jgi:hypothetical protein
MFPYLKILPLCLFVTIVYAHSGSFHDDLVPANEAPEFKATCTITIKGDKLIIESNGIPEHSVGRFPNPGNPHSITTQRHHYEMPLHPEVANETTPLIRQPWGVALNGIPFDPGTAEYYNRDRDSVWNYEALSGEVQLGLDKNHAHVQPSGAYHYHGLPTALFKQLSEGKEQMTLLGWAADGFPLYGIYGYANADDVTSSAIELKSSYQVKNGNRPSGEDSPGGTYDGTFTIDYEYVAGSGDLDECGGRYGVTPEFPEGTYYYVLTEDYPFIPRMFRGTPDPSFERKRGGNGPPSHEGMPRPRRFGF